MRWAIGDDENIIDKVYTYNVGGSAVIVAVIVLLAVAIFLSSIIWLFTRTIAKAQYFPPRNSLITSLAMLTFVALIASVFTKNAALETIAATGVGAIAGALSNMFIRKDLETPSDEGEQVSSTRDPTTEANLPESPNSEE